MNGRHGHRKAAEGIRLFARDQEKLEYQLATRH